MAGGEGTRLRPLTCDCPKPMLPLMGKPLMEYAIRLLKQYDITEIAVTLGYLPDAVVDYFGDGADWGVHLHYYIEKTPLGTAGSVKQAQNFLDERFIVLSGDGITDFDLHAALDFHHKNDAAATLLLKKCSRPQEYGMVVTDAQCRILSFHEKPGRCDVFSDRINTGIYIMEPSTLSFIPENQPCDFGSKLFPQLLSAGMPLYGYTADGYWCDVGDVPAYLRVHKDAMDGRIHLEHLSSSPIQTDGAVLESGSKLDPPCFIGKNTHIAAGAHIGPYTVIGANCSIAPSADIKHSVLFDGAHIQCGSQLRGCVIGKNAVVGESAQLYEDSVVGSRSQIGNRAILPPCVKLWPDKNLPAGERPEDNIVWGSQREHRFVGSGLEMDNPIKASGAAQACAAELKCREVLLGRSSSAVAEAAWHAAAAGLLAYGVKVIDAGAVSLPQLRHTQRVLCADAAILVSESLLIPLEGNGTPLNEKRQRAILKLCERQDHVSSPGILTRPLEIAGRTDISYIAHAASAFQSNPSLAAKIVVFAQDTHLRHLAEQAFARAGIHVRCEWDPRNMQLMPDEIAVYLSEDGQQSAFADQNGRMDDAHRQLLIAWTALQAGDNRLILHNSATRAIAAMAEKSDSHVQYLPGDYALWISALAEKSPLQFQLHLDGIYSALAILSALTEKGLSLAQWQNRMPPVYRKSASVQAPASQYGRLLHNIVQDAAQAEFGGGVRILEQYAWAWLSPNDRQPELNIVAEAMSMEAAESMCDGLAARLKKLLAQ